MPHWGRLQCAGPADLPRLLELAAYARHHAKRANVALPAEDVGDAGLVHIEALDGPVPSLDGPVHAQRDVASA